MDLLSFYSFIFPTVANNIFIYIFWLLSLLHPHRHFACCAWVFAPKRACLSKMLHILEGERERARNTPRGSQTDHLPRHRLRTYHARKLGRLVCTAVWAKSFRPALGDSLGSLGCSVACLPLFVAYI